MEYNRSFIYQMNNKRFPEKLNDTLFYLNKISDICKKHDLQLVVVIIPGELQIHQELLGNIKEAYPELKNKKLDLTLPNRKLSNKLYELGIDHIDLYEYFLERSNQQLYRVRDSHWNIEGNQLAANIIQKYIQKYFRDNK